jgi:hypothetical protein
MFQMSRRELPQPHPLDDLRYDGEGLEQSARKPIARVHGSAAEREGAHFFAQVATRRLVAMEHSGPHSVHSRHFVSALRTG